MGGPPPAPDTVKLKLAQCHLLLFRGEGGGSFLFPVWDKGIRGPNRTNTKKEGGGESHCGFQF